MFEAFFDAAGPDRIVGKSKAPGILIIDRPGRKPEIIEQEIDLLAICHDQLGKIIDAAFRL